MVAGFANPRHQCCLFFCLDYDANIATNKQRNNCNERHGTHGALPYKSWEKASHFPGQLLGRAKRIGLLSPLPELCTIHCVHIAESDAGASPRPPFFKHWLKLLFMWQWSCRETISHIRMVKLIERDAGDKEREQRQLFVTSLHLTGIIRYMKLKFHSGGSC